ncbi:MAG TPA: discoidin domain-containing protein [Dermatophilaceae bacterium]|jgi:glucosylceramidase
MAGRARDDRVIAGQPRGGKVGRGKALGVFLGVTALMGSASLAAASGSSTMVSVSTPTSTPSGVASYLTTPDKAHLLEAQTPLPLTAAVDAGMPTVTVDGTERYQTMDGFGASLTESAASVLAALPAAQRSQVISSLFSPTSGAGLSFLRQPMGASDFALGNYTYDDMPAGQTDPALGHFSINRDTALVLPQLRQALAANPAISIMATPFSPPAWMRTGGSVLGGGGTLRPAAYDAYAAYFVKFLQGYASTGVPVGAVTVQNEPEYAPPGYPGMLLSAMDEAAFIPHLATALRVAGLNTKIVAFDHNWDLSSYAESVLGDSTAGPLVDGTAFHCYGGDVSAQGAVHNAYPGKNIYFTECSGGDWSPDFAANLNWATHNLVIGATRNWAKTVATWNLALDTNHGPTNGGCMDCTGLITVNTATGAVTYNDSYYALGQIAKVVHPGAVRIASTSDPNGVETVAFQNRNGSYALVTHNTTGSAAPLTVREGQYAFRTTLPAGAVRSFTWSDPISASPPPTPTVGVLPRDGWTASASSTPSGSGDVVAHALDGNLSTRWSSGQAQTPGQWFQVDMARVQSVNEVALDAGPSTGDYPRQLRVLTSTDGQSWRDVGASPAPSGPVGVVTFPVQQARYIRLVGAGSTGNWWSIAELQVALTNTPTALDRTGWVATASSAPNGASGGDVPANALDGTSTTRWSSGQPQTGNEHFTLDLGSTREVQELVLDAGLSVGDFPRQYRVLTSVDGVRWSTPVAAGQGSGAVTDVRFLPQPARYLAVLQDGTSGSWWSIAEARLLD